MVFPNPESMPIMNYMLPPGCVAANAKVLPNIGPTHGVHPAANAAPNTNDVI